MGLPPEPDDVDFYVSDAGSLSPAETRRAIQEHRRRPEHRAEMAEAEEILAALGINFRVRGTEGARPPLEQPWDFVEDSSDADGEATDGPRDDLASDPVNSGPWPATSPDRSA